jgi:RimJ/RimL family protein N-acetyltransferase
MSAHPLPSDLPDRLETERLILRAPRAGDGRAMNAAVLETLADLQRFPASLPWATPAPSVDDSETFCRRAQATIAARTDLPMLLWCKRTGALAGATGLHRIDWTVPKADIGYWCRRGFQGQGLVTEAVRAVTAFAFDTLGVRRVALHTEEANQASRRVAERAGFTLESVVRQVAAECGGEMREIHAKYIYAQVR